MSNFQRIMKGLSACLLPAACAAVIGCQDVVDSQDAAKTEVEAGSSARVSAANRNQLLVHGTSGQFSGEYDLVTPNTNHNPIIDWVYWGFSSAQSVNRKSGVEQTIANFTTIPSGLTVQRMATPASPAKFRWTGGTSVSSASNVSSSVYTTGAGRGFRLAIKTGSYPRVLRLFAGVHRARGRLRVSMSDGSSPQVVSEQPENRTGTSYVQHTISYGATNAGAVLYVEWTMAADFGSGRVMLQAAHTWQLNQSPVTSFCGWGETVAPGSSSFRHCEILTIRPWSENIWFLAEGVAYDPDYQIVSAKYFNPDGGAGISPLPAAGPYNRSWQPFRGEYRRLQMEVVDNYGDTQRSNVVTFITPWEGDFVHDVPVPIPDADPAGITLFMQDPGWLGGTNQLKFAELLLDIDHTYVGDLRVYLVNSRGGYQSMVLNRGGSSDNMQLVFRAVGGHPVSMLPTLSGFEDVQPEQSFDMHYNEHSDGIWRLHIIDDYLQDVGSIRRATLWLAAK